MAGSVAGSHHVLILFYVLAVAVAAAAQNVTSDEEYWAKRTEEAAEKNRAAFVSDPIAAMNRFNKEVQRATTRRGLRRSYKGPCMATNPIDRCWRCRADWASDRKRLARCAMGFGHKTAGGADGKIYVVTDPTDDDMIIPKRGTLRYGVIQDRPLWITFARDMVITLQQELIGNRFIAPDDVHAKEVTKREYTSYADSKEWVWKSQGDVMLNGAFFNESGGQNERKYDELDMIPAKHGRFVGKLTQFAGTLKCRVGKPC
ncbi:hypothetical protein PR202_gb17919 [Eleusine coracana subsp. coracana]|uniref:Pectate lyase N-terminal domain-containing protein n=1 Tax=Eleusine coracana subsp. coracana TaxID=191504 RepID=A0AAV5F5S3_ELECO|nr:hypothetical protein PR202_gb17919 [Eleusine coracana subsp. coracana]